ATSSVDTRTELLVQQAMSALRADRTSFVIAHRLSTILDADMILVMQQGRIVEQGTHTELLDRRGHYYDLYNSQFAAAIEVDEDGGSGGGGGGAPQLAPAGVRRCPAPFSDAGRPARSPASRGRPGRSSVG